jgi:hypothetical protein
MVLLYMDSPYAAYWSPYVQNPTSHDRAQFDGDPALRDELVDWLVSFHVDWLMALRDSQDQHTRTLSPDAGELRALDEFSLPSCTGTNMPYRKTC